METIRLVIDKKLLNAADRAAKRQNLNRSALIRQALHDHLKRENLLELQERERQGYLAHPQDQGEVRIWEDAAAWPKE